MINRPMINQRLKEQRKTCLNRALQIRKDPINMKLGPIVKSLKMLQQAPNRGYLNQPLLEDEEWTQPLPDDEDMSEDEEWTQPLPEDEDMSKDEEKT
ncbi:hypothetical protein CHUAL_009586 [Chamberlinius hualienensis]